MNLCLRTAKALAKVQRINLAPWVGPIRPLAPMATNLLIRRGRWFPKGARRYRYYVSRGLNLGPAERMRDAWRLPATDIERTVVAAAHRLLGDEPAIATAVEEAGVTASQIPAVLETTRAWALPTRVAELCAG